MSERYLPHVSDVEIPAVTLELDRRALGGNGRTWHLSMRPCPECGYLLGCDGDSHYLCNRCGWGETKDVRKYRPLAVGTDRKAPYGMIYGKGRGRPRKQA